MRMALGPADGVQTQRNPENRQDLGAKQPGSHPEIAGFQSQARFGRIDTTATAPGATLDGSVTRVRSVQLLVRAGDGRRPLRQGLGLLDHSLMNARPRDRPRDRPRPTGPHHRTRNRALDPGLAGSTRARSGDGAPAVSRIAGESMEFATVARAQKRCSMTFVRRSFVRFERLTSTPENRGVPGSSPGLAIAGNACKSAAFCHTAGLRNERLRATEVRKVPNEVPMAHDP